jgi:hypothetical protein
MSLQVTHFLFKKISTEHAWPGEQGIARTQGSSAF